MGFIIQIWFIYLMEFMCESWAYNINLSDQERKLMEAWDKQDPIDEWEIEKNRRIEKIQGKNTYIK